MELTISAWSDVACPWCWVGMARLRDAMKTFGERESIEIRVIWRSFELDPREKDPLDETPYVMRLAKKYRIPSAQAQGMIDNMVSTGRDAGIAFDFERAIPANTFDAHRLLHWALTVDPSGGAQGRLKEALFAAHFTLGRDVGSREGLLSAVGAAELDVDAAASVLCCDDFAEAVRADEEEAGMHGVTGVPFFAIGRFGVGGAQREGTLIEVMERALAEQKTALAEQESVQAVEGEVCTPETC